MITRPRRGSNRNTKRMWGLKIGKNIILRTHNRPSLKLVCLIKLNVLRNHKSDKRRSWTKEVKCSLVNLTDLFQGEKTQEFKNSKPKNQFSRKNLAKKSMSALTSYSWSIQFVINSWSGKF